MKQNNPLEILLRIAKFRADKKTKIFSVGCGPSGKEAINIARFFPKASVIGVDKNLGTPKSVPKNCVLCRSDFTCFVQKQNQYNLVYCFHTLEHMEDPDFALRKISHVLKKDGVAIIGFPNKSRVLGYINPSENFGILEKILANLADYKKRLTRKFDNRHAHAGFYEKEFRNIAKKYFKKTLSIRKNYYQLKYPHFRHTIAIVDALRLGNYLFPSNYFILSK